MIVDSESVENKKKKQEDKQRLLRQVIAVFDRLIRAQKNTVLMSKNVGQKKKSLNISAIESFP